MFSEKQIVAFINGIVFIQDFTKHVGSHVFALGAWTLKKANIVRCQKSQPTLQIYISMQGKFLTN